MIANGDKYLWNDTDNEDVQRLKSFAQSRILPLASSIHKTKGMVRDCSHVSSTNIGEEGRSNYIFLRSINTYHVNSIAKKTREGHELHGNVSTKDGTKDERELGSVQAKKKHKGNIEDEGKTRERTRGKIREKLMVRWTWTAYKDIAHKSEADHSRMKKMLNSLKSNLKRVQLKMEKDTGKVFTNHSQNKRQKKRGVDQTFRSMVTVQYQILKGYTHSSLLKDKLFMRVLEYGEGKAFKWREYIKVLKEYEKMRSVLYHSLILMPIKIL